MCLIGKKVTVSTHKFSQMKSDNMMLFVAHNLAVSFIHMIKKRLKYFCHDETLEWIIPSLESWNNLIRTGTPCEILVNFHGQEECEISRIEESLMAQSHLA